MTQDRSVPDLPTEPSGPPPRRAPAPGLAPDPEPDLPLARAALRRRRRRDAAVALQLAGAALFLTPVVDLFGAPGRILGLPAGPVLLFAAWFALIALAARAGGEEER